MTSLLTGIHHVTAFAKDPVRNRDFYTGVLGLRMVKKTVNFDDPLTYHLYYGDEQGSPGTLLTHFPHPRAKPGVHGSPEIIETVLSVPRGAASAWAARLSAGGVDASFRDDGAERRLAFADHDGMRLAIVERAGVDGDADRIAGIDGVVINVPDAAATRRFLEDVLGFEEDGAGTRLALGGEGPGAWVELVEAAPDARTLMGAGTVHHVAWRVPDDAAQADAARALSEAGAAVTRVMDRQYFRSIYVRIPGGVIFEIATDGPGFDIDEPFESLGADLKLPPQHESRRSEIEAHLIPLSDPVG